MKIVSSALLIAGAVWVAGSSAATAAPIDGNAIKAAADEIGIAESVHCRPFRHWHRWGYGRGCRPGVVIYDRGPRVRFGVRSRDRLDIRTRERTGVTIRSQERFGTRDSTTVRGSATIRSGTAGEATPRGSASGGQMREGTGGGGRAGAGAPAGGGRTMNTAPAGQKGGQGQGAQGAPAPAGGGSQKQ